MSTEIFAVRRTLDYVGPIAWIVKTLEGRSLKGDLQCGPDRWLREHVSDPLRVVDVDGVRLSSLQATLVSLLRVGESTQAIIDALGWHDAEIEQPPTDGVRVFVGFNTAGYAGCFNVTKQQPDGTLDAIYASPEVEYEVMSELKWWRELDRPAP